MENYQRELMRLIDERNKKIQNEPHFKTYNEARFIHNIIMNKMFMYFQKHEKKYQQRLSDLFASRREMMNNNPNIGLFKMEGKNFSRLMACYIYPVCDDYESISEYFYHNKMLVNPDENEMLFSILQSKYGIFKIIKNDYKHAKLIFKDMITNEEIEIIDSKLGISLDFSGADDDIYVVCRILSYRGINFTDSGTILDGYEGSDTYKDIVEFINKMKLYSLDSFDVFINAYLIEQKQNQ